jgi:hypothetical protein
MPSLDFFSAAAASDNGTAAAVGDVDMSFLSLAG